MKSDASRLKRKRVTVTPNDIWKEYRCPLRGATHGECGREEENKKKVVRRWK